MEGETEWARAEGPPLLSRRLTDQAVKVGTRTRLLVEIASSSPLTVVWLHEGKKVEENERIKLVNEGNFYCVDISPVTLDDEGIWKCQGHNARGLVTSQAKLTLVVPRAYKKPEFVEPLKAVLGSAGTVSLETKVIGVPTPTLKWYKEGEEIKPGDVLGLTPDPLDPTLGTYTCIATNCMGSTVSTSRVHVVSPAQPKMDLGLSTSGPKPIFAKELRNEKVKIGTTLSLDCQVKVPPWPDRVSWYNSVGEVKEGPRAHLMEDGMGGYSIRVSPIQASDDGIWRFVATNRGGSTSVTTCNVSVSHPKNYRKPKFLDSLKAVLTEEGLVSFECKVVGYPTPLLSWFKDGQELKPGDVYQLTGTNSLGSYCCIARNCMGEAESTAVLTVEDIQSQLTEEERLQLFSDKLPPKFIQGLKSVEAKISEPFSFSVKVSVSPEPTVLWFRDDEHIDESEPRYKLEKDKLGLYSLHIARLEFVDQAEWKCVAMNDFGQSVTSSYLKLNIPRHYKKPKFLEELRAVLSDEGAVNLECKVIGVPQPVLKWFKDGKELKPGDIHRIISGQDGSCCLGTYTCMAQNCMGTVSSSASLLGFQDKGIVGSGVTPKVPEKTNTCVRDTSLSTIQEERTSQLHDTDKSLTLDDRPEEVSFSFDGREVSVSLYETPDLTEEEALQIVEMYADQISEHVSEHNVVELPPMRFTKESSTSGKLLMEAMVIDVSPDYFTPGEVDDLRTDADLEEFSLVEEAMVTPEEEKADIEFPSSPTRQEEMLQFPGRKISQPTPKEEKNKRKKRKSTDSDKEDDSLQEFERRKTEKRPFKERKRTESEMEDDSLYEFESRKVIGQNEPKLVENKNDRAENVSESYIEVFESGERPSLFKTAELISPGHSRRSLTEDDKTYNTAEESAFDKSEMSVLETLAQSLQEIQRGLAFVEAKVISESQELLSPEASILESLAQPIAEVQRSLEVMEEKLDEALIGSQVLETLVQPISEFKKSLKMMEEEEALKRKASSIMESLARPLQELEREIALIQEQCYSQRQLSSEERYAKSVEEVQETLTRIIERQESVPHDRKLMKTISVELQELEETANDDLEKYYDRLLACSSELRKKLNDEHDQEIVDILRSMGDLVKPLKRLSAVTSKCISVIVKDYELGGMPSAKLVESLVKPLEALKSSLDLLESVSNLKSHRAIRGVGIPLLYKMSVPMEELQTTIKLVENLSAHTAVEFLVAPLENLIKVVSTIDISTGGEGFLENLGKEGPDLLKGINNSLNTIKNTMSSIKANSENVESERELIEKLPNIVKPMEDLQRSLKPIQENIGEDLSYDEVCEVAQNLSKPLQSLRSELSILQHEIEIEHYGDITGEKKSVLSELIEPLEAVQTSIKCFHESILCKEDPIHLRFVLYALKEMAEPFNILCSKVTKTEEAILQGKVLDPYQGLKNVTKAVRELKETSSLTKKDLPVVHGISSTLSKPLDLVENGLSAILDEVYYNDKGDLNINMLKTLAEPFMVLQSALLDIDSESLRSENEFPELKQAIKDLQRSVLVIQDHVSFEYGDEPSTTESNIVMLESLVQPLQLLRSQISDIQRASLRTLIKTDRVLTDIRDSSKDIIAAINVHSEENDPLSELLKKLGKTVEELGIAADIQNIQIGQGQMLDEARGNMANILTAVATSFGETCTEADELSTQLNTEQRKTLISIQDMILDLKSSVETAVEIMDENKIGIEQHMATASALEQVKCAMYDFNHSFSSMNEVQPKPPKKSISMDELKDFVVQLESDVNLVIDKISSTVDRNVAQPVLDNILDDVKSVKYAVLKMIEERNLDENRIQYVLEKVKFIENDLNELSQNTLEHEYIPLNEACKTAQAIVSMQDQLIPNSRDEYDYHEVIDTLVENVKCLESVVGKLEHDSNEAQNDDNLVAISENLMILQECITPLTSGEKQMEMLHEQLRQMKLPIKVIEQSLHNIKIDKEDMNEALQALIKVSEICIKKDSSTKSEYFDSKSLESIHVTLLNTITETIESMRSTFKDIKDKKPVKLAWFIDSFEETLVTFGKEFSDNISNFDEPQVRQKLIECIQKLKTEISDLRVPESGPLNELKKAVMSLDAAMIEPPQQILSALQNLVKPLKAVHENILDVNSIRKEEFKCVEDYSKVSGDLEIGLIKLEKALVTSEELDFKVMSKPLEILYSYAQSINNNPLFEFTDEDSSIVQLATLSEHIAEIKTCLDEIETTVTIHPGDKKKIEALLIKIAKPVRELKHNVALIQEQALLTNVELKSSELEDLKVAVAVVCSHIEEDKYLRAILNPVYVLKEKLEKASPESFNPSDVVNPVKELKIALEEIEKESIAKTEFSYEMRTAEPLLDLCHNVIQIIENRVMESLGPELTHLVEHPKVKNIPDQLVRAVPITVETELCEEEKDGKDKNNELLQPIEKKQKQIIHDEVSVLKHAMTCESVSEVEAKNEDKLIKNIEDKNKVSGTIEKNFELELKENKSAQDTIEESGPLKDDMAIRKDEGKTVKILTKDKVDDTDLNNEKKENVELKADNEERIIAKEFEIKGETCKDVKELKKPSTSIEVSKSKGNKEKKPNDPNQAQEKEEETISSNKQTAECKDICDDTSLIESIVKQDRTLMKEQNENSQTKALNSKTVKEETEVKRGANIYKEDGTQDKTIKTEVLEGKQFLNTEYSEKPDEIKKSQDAEETIKKQNKQDSDLEIEMQLKIDEIECIDPILKENNKIEETGIDDNKTKDVNKDVLPKVSKMEKKEDLHLMVSEQIESKNKQTCSIGEKLFKLREYIKQLESEIISSISFISKTNANFSVKPILESVLVDIKSMDRVVEKLLQDQKVDYTRLKFIVDKARFIGEDLKFVVNSNLLKEECRTLNDAAKTIQDIMLLQLIGEDSKEKEAIKFDDKPTEEVEIKRKITKSDIEKTEENLKSRSKKDMQEKTKSESDTTFVKETMDNTLKDSNMEADKSNQNILKDKLETKNVNLKDDQQNLKVADSINKEGELLFMDEFKEQKNVESVEVREEKTGSVQYSYKTDMQKSNEEKLSDVKEDYEMGKQGTDIPKKSKEESLEEGKQFIEKEEKFNKAAETKNEKSEKDRKDEHEANMATIKKQLGKDKDQVKKKEDMTTMEYETLEAKKKIPDAKKGLETEKSDEEEAKKKVETENLEEDKAEMETRDDIICEEEGVNKKKSKSKENIVDAEKDKNEVEEEFKKVAEIKEMKEDEEKIIQYGKKSILDEVKSEDVKTRKEAQDVRKKMEDDNKVELKATTTTKESKENDKKEVKEKLIQETEVKKEEEIKKKKYEKEKSSGEAKTELKTEDKINAKNDVEVKQIKDEEERGKIETEAKNEEDNIAKKCANNKKDYEGEEKVKIEVEIKNEKEETEKAKEEAELIMEKEEDKRVKLETEMKREKEEKFKTVEEAKQKKDIKEKVKVEEESKKKTGEVEKVKVEEEAEQKKEEEEEKVKIEDKATKKKEVKIEVEDKKKIEEEEIKLKATRKNKKGEEEKAKLEAECNKNKEEEIKLKNEEDERIRNKSVDNMKKDEEEMDKKKADDNMKKEKSGIKIEEEQKFRKEGECLKKTEEEQQAQTEDEIVKKKEDEERGKKEAKAKMTKEDEEKAKMVAEESKKKKEGEETKMETKTKNETEEEEKARKELESKKKREEEEKTKKELEAEKKKQEEDKLKQKEEEEKARKHAEAKQKKEEVEKSKKELESSKKKEEEEKVKQELEAKQKKEEEKLKQNEEAKKKKEEEEKAKKELEVKKKKEQEEKAKQETEAKKKKEEEPKAKKDLEAKLKKEEEKAKKELEDKNKKEDEEKINKELEAKKKKDEEEKAQKELETKKKKEEEEKARKESEAKKIKEEEEKAKKELEDENKKKEEEKVKKELEVKKKKEEDEIAQMELETKKKTEEEEKSKNELEAKKITEEEEKSKKELEAKQKKEEEDKLKQKEEEEKARQHVEAKQKKEEEEKAKKELESNKKKEEEEKAKKELEAKKKKEEEEKARKELEVMQKKEEEEEAKKELESKKKKEEEEKSRKELEAKKKKEEEEKAQKELEAKKKKEEEEKAQKELEAKKKKEEEEKAQKELEAKKRKEEEEKAQKELEAKKKKEEEEKAKKELEAKKKKEEEEKARKELEAKKKKEEEEKAQKELEAKKKKEEEEKAQKELEAKKKKEEEEKAQKELEAKKKKEEEEKAQKELEAKKKKEEEEKAQKELEAKKKKEEEEKAQKELEAKKKKEEEEKAQKELEAKKKKEEEEKAQKELEAKKKKEEEEKAQKELEAKKKKEEEEKAQKELEAKKKKEEEEKAQKELEAKKKKEEEEKAQKELEAKKRKEEDERARKELEAKQKQEEENLKQIEDAKKKKEEEEKARKEAEAKQKQEEENLKQIEDAKKKKEEEEKSREEAEAKQKKEEEEKAQTELEAKKKKEEEQNLKQKEKAKKKKEEEEKTRKDAEAKQKKEDEEKALKELKAKKKKEEEEKAQKELEANKKKAEDVKARNEAEVKQKKEEDEKLKREEEAKKKKEEEEKAKKEAEGKLKKEEEEKTQKELDAKKKKEKEEKTQKELEAKKKKKEEERPRKNSEAKKKKEEEEMAGKEGEFKQNKDEEEKAKIIAETKMMFNEKDEISQVVQVKKIKEEIKPILEMEAKKRCENDDKINNLTGSLKESDLNSKIVKTENELEVELFTNEKSESLKLDEVQISMKEIKDKEKVKNAAEKRFSSEANVRPENQIEVVELDPEDEFFWVGKGSSGSASTYRYPGSDSGYSENIKSYLQSSPSSRKYLIDGNLNIETNYISPKHISRSSSYEATTTNSYLSQSKLKQYLTQSGSDIREDLSPRSYAIQDDYSKKDFSVIHSSRPTEFLMKDYSHNTGSPALDSLRRRIEKSWNNLNRHMSHEYLSSGVKPDTLSKEFGGSADQLSSKDIYKDFLYVPYKEDFSALAQSRRYTRRRSASPLPVISDSTAMVRQRSVSRSRYEYHERQPYICSPLRDKRVEHGANVKLTCNIGGDPEPIVEWRKDGQPIESIIDRFVVEYSFGVASLEIKSVIASDAGQYTCVAINPAGQAATTATLRVNTEHWQGMEEYGLSQEINLPLRVPEVSPRVTGLIADSLVPSGGVIALHLQIQGCPRAEVTWLREGVPLKFSPRTHTLVDPSMGLHTFLVEGVTVSESGLYHCRVLSGSSRLLEPAPAHIQVVERRPGDKPALITARPETRITLTSGEDLTLTCYVSGEPKPRVMLMKGIKDITDGERTLKESFGEYIRLTLKRALPEDSGTYFIVARNPYGTDRAFSTVKIRERTRSLTPTRRERSSSVYRETLCNGSSYLSMSYF
ncbi:unnamed protein product [Nezara viridula]|uniref:Ig-like domain-containing protein n=1 Tax=Nezara viridula TaxID=85310 RepID=A0A9P0E1L2_NEZVI|nr:unnamed protein product [Nezara viridula]